MIAVAPCEPDQVDRYGVIAGDFVGTLEGYEGAGETDPGAVWRIGGLVEKPSPEAAPSSWIAANALMAASDPRFAGEFWAAIDERGGLER